MDCADLLAPQTLLVPVTKEVTANAAPGGAWVNMTLRQIIRTGVGGSTQGDIHNAVGVVEPPYQILIRIVYTSPSCELNANHQVANKRKYTPLGLVGKTQILDAVVDGKLPEDLDSASIFSKVIGHRLSDGSCGDLYTR